ncbi:MAG TPA: PQQ-binding-like beta-propeller repeat protein [Armatimonadota bacterium]|nr:PQQ-binding-like beta-propeller repeat protein [Armatimonadota bacterium]
MTLVTCVFRTAALFLVAVLVLLMGCKAPESAAPGGGLDTQPPDATPASDASLADGNWPRFRGPRGDGGSASVDILSSWEAASGEGILWTAAIPLPGTGSPVVWENRIFCTGATADAQQVYCLDATTGDLLWTGDAPAGSPMPEVMEMTGFAAPTPVTDGRHVCALFANGMLVCLDVDGNEVWHKDLGVPENPYGLASSPITHGDLVIVQYDHGYDDDDLSFLLALHVDSGDVAWQVSRDTAASWATPLLIRADGRDELITCAKPWVIANDPVSGDELWRVDCIDGELGPSPTFAGGLVLIAGEGTPLTAIRPGGSGDVTVSHVAWQFDDGIPDICSPASDGELVFTLMTYGLLTCLQVADGELIWQEQLDGSFLASPATVGDKLYVTTEEGETLILSAGREFAELGRSSLGEPVSASPAFAEGRIYMRGASHVYCIGE